ncbi:hypothetical protein EDD86DRAFT_199160 [Gorgonomyces haynaldii]|nr:hypothetical protein EDD86DRAFT_199160 [Gorgonomyces haynaldii]
MQDLEGSVCATFSNLCNHIGDTNLRLALFSRMSCFKLTGSKQCPGFTDFEIHPSIYFKNVQEFDQFIQNHLLTNQQGVSAFKQDACANYAGGLLPNAVFSLCAAHVATYKQVSGCSKDKQLNFCQSTIKSTADAVQAIWNDQKQCTKSPNDHGNNPYRNVVLFEKEASTQSNCLSTQGTESICGFSSRDEAVKFCAASSIPCCSTLTATMQPVSSTIAPVSATSASPAAASSTAALASPKSATADAPQSQSINPLYIGVGLGAAVVLLMIIFATYYAARRKPSTRPPVPSKAVEPAQIADTMQVIHEYEANLFDEVTLNVGDHIIVKVKFDDGWAAGFNMNTKQEGTFPLACVAPLDSDFDAFTETHRDSWSYSHRHSSISAYPK